MDNLQDEETDEMRSLHADDIGEVFQEAEMPMTTEEVIERHGDKEVDYPGGSSERLESILTTSGMEEYESVDELELAILNGVGRDAVGRPRYSDRSDEVNEELERQDESF